MTNQVNQITTVMTVSGFASKVETALYNYDNASKVIVELALEAIQHYHNYSHNKDLIVAMSKVLKDRPRLLKGFVNMVRDCTLLNEKLEQRKLSKKAKKETFTQAQGNLSSYYGMLDGSLNTLNALTRLAVNGKKGNKDNSENDEKGDAISDELVELEKATKKVQRCKKALDSSEIELNALLPDTKNILTTDQKLARLVELEAQAKAQPASGKTLEQANKEYKTLESSYHTLSGERAKLAAQVEAQAKAQAKAQAQADRLTTEKQAMFDTIRTLQAQLDAVAELVASSKSGIGAKVKQALQA